MKRRFILIIFCVLLVSTAAVSALHFYFLRGERLRLIDTHLETIGEVLISSDISRMPFHDAQAAETFLFDVLGNQRIGKIIVLRDSAGNVVFSSRNAHFLPRELPADIRWQTVRADNHELRLLALPVPNIGKTLQVGILLDTELLYWRQLDKSFAGYALGVVALLLAVSYLLANLLLSPLRKLAVYLDYLSTEISGGFSSTKTIPSGLMHGAESDEFNKLIRAVSRLTENLRLNMRMLQSWTAMMAHEIKTPLTVIRNQLEGIQMHGASDDQSKRIHTCLHEMERLNHTVTGFLDWASLENSVVGEIALHAISLADMVQRVCDNLNALYDDRLKLSIHGNPTVFASPQHVEQTLTNLVTNALRYSPKHEIVEVELSESELWVRDRGKGLPVEVINRLGQPFNVYRQEGIKGTGLGLAWVMAVLKRYEWKIDFTTPGVGTAVRVYGWT